MMTFIVIVFLVLLNTLTNATMTCTTPYVYYHDATGFPNYKVICCQNAGYSGGLCASPDAADYEIWCNSIFPIGTGPSLCNCGLSCSGQVIEAPIPNGSCVGACTCTGVCCDDGAPCAPTAAPTTAAPTNAPTKAPTKAPTSAPTAAPTTKAPTKAPTEAPTQVPLATPTEEPSAAPTEEPTEEPTSAPTVQGDSGLGLAMGLIFGPIGAMAIIGVLYLVYLNSQVPKRF